VRWIGSSCLLALPREGELKAAVDRGRDPSVAHPLRVALLPRGEAQQQLLRGRRVELLATEREARRESGDDRRRRAAEPAPRRHGVLALEAKRRHRLLHQAERLCRHAHDDVRFIARQRPPALALDVHRERVRPLDHDAVVHVQGDAQAVEAWTQVARGRGHRQLDPVHRPAP